MKIFGNVHTVEALLHACNGHSRTRTALLAAALFETPF